MIDPVAFSIGPLSVHWYGLMYLLGAVTCLVLSRLRLRCEGWKNSGWTSDDFDDLLIWGMVGVICGGRLGYVLFYGEGAFLRDPVDIFRIWQGGMSFHGGLLGVLIAVWFWSVRHGRSWIGVLDFAAPFVPPGLFFGRIGNFINGELWGAPTDLPWGIVFPDAGSLPRHPSQLYEAGIEGCLLFIVLWLASLKPQPAGRISGLFAVLYAIGRFSIEFVRVPDAHIGYIAFGWLTMGQILSLPLLIVGIYLLYCSLKDKRA